ncbi:hypothetical protein Hypma_015925 [Hypsizygus marmoreus]|uniref:Uncharacterized protein n=1 Tax=Hypsizygus marmoreus TaxID=39966 RepID=A0A369K1H4_HYPMA|nr:hypothetical protein Hypma_015925 [Hypsizygus marmoreus]
MVHPVIAGAAGFVYASIGFSLSVLAILLGLLTPARFTPPPFEGSKPPALSNLSEKRRGRALYTNSKDSSDASISSSAPSTPKDLETYPSVAIVSSTNTPLPRSPSPYQRVEHADDPSFPKSNRKPTTVTFIEDSLKSPSASTRTAKPLPSERICLPSEDGQNGFKISSLKPPWGDKRRKIYRCVSSPHLTTANPPIPSPVTLEEEQKLPPLLKKKSKTLRKAPSHPSTPRSASCPTIALVEKKQRPPALRTQPYEAPYFFPPPIPNSPPQQRKPVRSRTLPPISRKRPTSPEGKVLTIGGSLAPPTDHRIAPRK